MKISDKYNDALKEVINIGIGRAADMLNQMVQSHIQLQVPNIEIIRSQELKNFIATQDKKRNATVQLHFKGTFSGMAALIFPTVSAAKLLDVITGEDFENSDLDSVKIGTLTEVGNIVINGVVGSISNMLKKNLVYSIPSYFEDTLESLIEMCNSSAKSDIVLVQTRFSIEQLQIVADLLLLFEIGTLNKLVNSFEDIEFSIK